MTDHDPKAKHLKAYFQQRKPDCQIRSEYKFDEMTWRFYFVADSKNRYILDVTEALLDDSSVEQIIGRLESAKWESILKENVMKIIVFGEHGFSLGDRPQS
ncbi:MAG TPA: hypothetical protein VKV95_10305 [Terriglobia bacterium]|nr:hypothetical protein [Terriglobia bacterium]